MSPPATAPILLVGGSGVVGREAARRLRAAYPDVPLLIGGRVEQTGAGDSETGGRA